MNREKTKKIVGDSVVLLGYLLMIVSLIMFLVLNDGVFFSTVGLGIIFMIALAILPVGYIVVAHKMKREVDNRSHRIMAVFSLIIAVILLVVSILGALVVDFVQPLVLNSMTNILLIVASSILLVGAVLELIFDNSRLTTVVASMMVVLMLVGIIWVHADGYKSFNDDVIVEKKAVFENGESGYATFRIPSIIALDYEDINNALGYSLEDDILLATAEGRKDSSHDTGSIDMVGKISKDKGATWSDLMVIYSYTEEVGKYGNPTPVLDRVTGDLIFPYMTATKANDYDYNTMVARAKISANGDITFPDAKDNLNISFEKGNEGQTSSDGVRSYTLMVGPGKSIQLKSDIHKNRLVIPASGGGDSFVMYSDDNGYTWKQSESAGKGNECEVVELENGELCMVTRANTGCCDNHFKQFQRLSYSKDGGATWYTKAEDTALRSPICMSSIDVLPSGKVLLSYPDSFYTRVNLTIGASLDNGKSFKTTSLYEGPAGYSCITVDSSNNIYVLAEIGKVNYNEELIFMRLDSSKI